ncbi:MAG: hypothetical protein K2X09_04425 [Rickettsiales bacterium]|nr:hypothetical protein [Rickettsiales bacterium]
MADKDTKETDVNDERNAQMRKDYMRTTDKASLIGSFSRFLGFLGGTSTSALMLAVGYTFNGAITAAGPGVGTSVAVMAGFTALGASTVVLSLFAVSLLFVGTSIALDYYTGHIFREKGLDQTELNAERTAHHLVMGVSQAREKQQFANKAHDQQAASADQTSAKDTADATHARSDGKSWIDAVGELAEQKHAAVAAPAR